MKRILAAVAVVATWLALSSTASADNPPGLLGYEGQPGNQGG